MALIKCPECGNSISDKAEKCPNCGLPSEYFWQAKTSDESNNEIDYNHYQNILKQNNQIDFADMINDAHFYIGYEMSSL